MKTNNLTLQQEEELIEAIAESFESTGEYDCISSNNIITITTKNNVESDFFNTNHEFEIEVDYDNILQSTVNVNYIEPKFEDEDDAEYKTEFDDEKTIINNVTFILTEYQEENK